MRFVVRRVELMNIVLWILQVLAALIYGASGFMKIFMFEEISTEVQSFGALPKEGWMFLGIIELVCVVGLIVPSAFRWKPTLTVLAAAILAIESVVFVWVHLQYGEAQPIIVSSLLGLVMVFIVYGRKSLSPIT
jgi:uncharacterized membrane protein YphA (DoxX/SURF4 family)